LVIESIVESKASTLLDFLHGLRGELHVTLSDRSGSFKFSGRQFPDRRQSDPTAKTS
jgi:hypothetical protein